MHYIHSLFHVTTALQPTSLVSLELCAFAMGAASSQIVLAASWFSAATARGCTHC